MLELAGSDLFHSVLSVNLRGSDFAEEDIWVFDEFADLEVLKLSRDRLTNASKARLEEKLAVCRIYDSKITEQDFELLNG
ncbi:MAG: hypothetical protein AAF664_21365 [Planctomycetota bacterium]